MATERKVAIYPDGASVPGGYAATYKTMALMEAGENADLTADTGIYLLVEITASDGNWNTADTTRVLFVGWICSYADGEYIRIITLNDGARNMYTDGKYSTSAYRLDVTGQSTIELANTASFSCIFDGIQLKNTDDTDQTLNIGSTNVTDIIKCENCYLWEAGGAWYNVRSAATTGSLYFTNCIVLGGANGLQMVARPVYIYNCTITEVTGDAIESDANNCYVHNCAVFNNTDDFQDTMAACTYCANDDDDGVVTSGRVDLNENASGEWTAAFTDYTTDDFRVKDTDSLLYHAGITNGDDANVPTTDIAGNPRVTASGQNCDIGAFEYVAAGGGTILPFMMAYHGG